MKSIIKHIILIFFFVLASCENKTNWDEHYRSSSKDPFGTYILKKELKNLFANSDFIPLKKHIHDYLAEDVYKIELITEYNKKPNYANYICINYDDGYKYDNIETVDKLLGFVSQGNDAFLAFNRLPQYLLFRLQVSQENLDTLNDSLSTKKGSLSFVNKKFKPSEFNFDRNMRESYFSEFKKKNAIVLGTQKINGEDKPIFIKVYYGKGAFYLHSRPIAFTNYYMLNKKTLPYVEDVFSYLKDRPKILWDPLLKDKKTIYDDGDNENQKQNDDSVLGFFWKNPPLKWALLVGFFGLLTFVFFNARRKQRAIPIIPELRNSTVDFIHTIANLYLVEKNPKNLIDKKIIYFLQKIRANYLIDTSKLNTEFIEKLSLKSGNTIENTTFLINSIINLQKEECTQEDLEQLNQIIEDFFKK